MALMMSPRSSPERNSCFFVSNRSKQTWTDLHQREKKRGRIYKHKPIAFNWIPPTPHPIEHPIWKRSIPYLKTLDLIVGKIGLLIDLLKVNVSIGISLAWMQQMGLGAVSLHFLFLQLESDFIILGNWDQQNFRMFEFTSHDSCWMRWGLWGRCRDTETLGGRGGGEGISLLLSFTIWQSLALLSFPTHTFVMPITSLML